MTPVAQALIFVDLGVSLSRESPYYPVEGTIEEVTYRLAGKTVDDDVHTLVDVTKIGDVPASINMLSVVTLDVSYAYAVLPMLLPVVMCAFMIVSKIMLRYFLAHVFDVLYTVAHDNDDCDDGGSEFCGCNFSLPPVCSRVDGFSELFHATTAAYGN